MPAGRPGVNTSSSVRDVLRAGPKTAPEVIAALPDHNASTIRNAMKNMIRFKAATKQGRVYSLAPGLDTEADYQALLQEFRSEKARRAAERAAAAKAPDRPYVPLLRTDPLAVALRSAW